MIRHSLAWVLYASLLLLLVPGIAGAQSLTADIEVYYPVPAFKPRGGGVAALGGSEMERIDAGKAPDGRAMLRLAGTQAPVQGAWWFPGHAPVTPEQALIGNPHARLLLEIQATKPVRSEFHVQWRVDGEPADWVGGAYQFGPGATTAIQVTVPPLKPGAKINGLLFSFKQPGEYQIRRIALAKLSSTLVDPIQPGALRQAAQVEITGRANPGINEVTLRFTPDQQGVAPVERNAPVRNGAYAMTIAAKDLQPGVAYAVTSEPAGRSAEVSPAQRVFAFPTLTGKACPPVVRKGADLIREGKRFGFVGVNYTAFYLGLGIRADYEMLAEDLLQMKSFGVRVARVPLHIGMIQPEMGLMPDGPGYKEALVKHGLDPSFVEQLDYFVALAGELGIYTVIDWHGMPVDPYRYFVGGREQERNSGKPGTAIAYLAPSATKSGEFDLANPVHVECLLNAHRWVARHFRGNPNLLCIEIPFNEPHTKYMAVETNWRRIVDLSAKAVAEGDPERLTFSLGSSYSHNNLLPSVTWLPPDNATGAAPHFYQANGPVPTRPDAASFREPWLARETEGTFGWSFPAVMMPFSAVDYPLYNGETGAHGAEMVLPDRGAVEATSILIEAQMVQEYAAGMAGRLEWTMWRNATVFTPHVETFRRQFNRFAPVYEAGPIDRTKARVAFVQHPEAVPSSNGHNFACIPFAKAALDLQLGHVHYLTDAQLRYTASAELSVGLEQVTEAAEELGYKALIVDRRLIDPRTTAVLKAMNVPTLWLDRAEDLTSDQLATFLQSAGVRVDLKTPRQLQLVEGPEHLVVYRRLDGGANMTRAFPQLNRTGTIELFDESGRSVFKGEASALAEQGLQVDLPLWRSAIYRIVQH